ncbi:MAG: hypothetical protein WKF59_19055 [Chitinophagaceae bacterium]
MDPYPTVKIPAECACFPFTVSCQPLEPLLAVATVFKPAAPSNANAMSACFALSIKSARLTASGEPDFSSSPVK